VIKDEDFDVFVTEGVLVEVWRGDRVSVAQQFGEKWDGPVHSVCYEKVFEAPLPEPIVKRSLASLGVPDVRVPLLVRVQCVALAAARSWRWLVSVAAFAALRWFALAR
jgi:hypothetical protein